MSLATNLTDKKILLGVTGGIAAYKAVYLLRLLKQAGAEVRVVMTPSATQFVTALTFETLSEHKVHIHMFEGDDKLGATSAVEHIDLAKWPDLIVIAPLTANTLANFARGNAEDLLANVVTAFAGRVLIAPAMNDVMWNNPATQENLTIVSNRGFQIVPPGDGDLACGYEATGRMAEPDEIFVAVTEQLDQPLSKIRVLVSVGGTEEDIDPVRVISNRSSGKMGFAMAEAARDLGADVTVVAANTSVMPPSGVTVNRVRTTAEMSHALKEAFVETDVLIMCAAVSDFKPIATLDSKKKKADNWSVDLEPTEDILQALGKIKGQRLIVGFALETDNVEANALDKLKRKNCDIIVVNNPNVEGAAFSHETNVVTIYDTTGKLYESNGPESKRGIARKILELLRAQHAFKKITIDS